MNPPDSLLGQLAEDARGIARATKRILPDETAELLLVIDQFEELFTLCDNESTRRRFLAALAVAVSDPASRVRVVATLRADFYDRPLAHRDISELIKASAVTVTPLAPDELERAIVDPAARRGVEFEVGLVAQIVADVTDEPAALPLLQYSLTELFERRVSGLITRSAYDDIGGVAGALAARAEELYAELDPSGHDLARRVFSRLVSLGEGTEDTRRRVTRAELGDAGHVIDSFGAARLLSFDRDPVSREPTVEVAHEALIQRWPRLRAWVDDDRDGLRILRHLHAAAADWDASDRPTSELYRGGRLEAAEQWHGSHQLDLNEQEVAFLEESVAERSREQAEERKRVSRLRRLLVGVAGLLVISVVVARLRSCSARKPVTSGRRPTRPARPQRLGVSALMRRSWLTPTGGSRCCSPQRRSVESQAQSRSAHCNGCSRRPDRSLVTSDPIGR